MKITHCLICGRGPIREVERDWHIRVKGAEVTVPGDRVTHCDSCGEDFYTGAQAQTSDRRLADVRRRNEGLLTGEEILRVRQAASLSQAQLEAALGVGAKTVVRWEKGTAVQSKAADDVLRLIALDRDNLRFLAEIRDVDFSDGVEQKKYSACYFGEPELEAAIRTALTQSGAVAPDRIESVVSEVARSVGALKEEKLRRMLARERGLVRPACPATVPSGSAARLLDEERSSW
jgi:HTH-type transcriptional regulator/antitoxin MqsA